MPPDPESPRPQLIVFSDDWGRHPSSCQHLVRHLMDDFDVLWVNTIGMRKPRWDWGELGRIVGVIGHWFFPPQRLPESAFQQSNLTVISPKMYPGFRSSWQRRFNARRIAKAVHKPLGPKPKDGHTSALRIVLTTLPITADLVGRLDADRWVYYCVDDFSVWPGVDHHVMDTMERELVGKADAAVAVSEVLIERIKSFQRQDAKGPGHQEAEPVLLTHGVDTGHWARPVHDSRIPKGWPDDSQTRFLFWGLIDERLDVAWLDRLESAKAGRIVVAGPEQAVNLTQEVIVTTAGPVDYRDLPALAASAEVLIMPYIDTPVTRAMQPLKLLEYLATMKPVVVRDLPSTRVWADCCDVVDNADDFARVCLERAETGTPPEQLEARRRRLPGESWSEKARRMREILLADAGSR